MLSHREKHSVLFVSNYFFPATVWGGPVFSLKAICEGIVKNERFSLSVLTTDAGQDRNQLGLNNGAEVTEKLPYDVEYHRIVVKRFFSASLLSRIFGHAKNFDIIHVTGHYTLNVFVSFIAAKWYKIPLVWSPRGALLAERNFSETRKARLKRFVTAVFRRIFDPKLMTIHSTSEEERSIMEDIFGVHQGAVITNGVELPSRAVEKKFLSDLPNITFISRIDSKKGIDILVEALAGIDREINLNVFGVGSQSYTDSIFDLARSKLKHHKVHFHGHVDGEMRERAFEEADVVVLPSHSENFGNILAEAMIRKTPIITTTGTPWLRVEEMNCGWCVAPTVPAIRAAIEEAIDSDLEAMGRNGEAWMKEEFTWETKVAQLEELYLRALEK